MKIDNSWVENGDPIPFQSELDRKYAEYLDQHDDVVSYRYKFMPIVYFDHVTGEELVYYIGFDIEYHSGREWVETIPSVDMRPEDKYLYAVNVASSHGVIFRGLKEEELRYIK